MLSPTKHSALASLLAVASNAQSSNSDVQSLTCDDLSNGLAHNASVVLNTTAINLNYLGKGDSVRIYDDDRFTWQVSSWIGPPSVYGPPHDQNATQPVLWLDTGDSDMERLGDILGLCHSYIPLQNSTTGNLTWSREVLERAQDDNGDCMTMLGGACVAALERWYRDQGRAAWYAQEWPACSAMTDTIPSECEGMLSPAISFDNRPFNLSSQRRIISWDRSINITSYPDDVELPTTCGERNLNTGWGNRASSLTDYDVALNFPIVDIMTFYPSIPVLAQQPSFSTHVKLVCLKPEDVQDGSRAPRSAKEVLDEYYGSQDEQDEEDDESGAERAFGWAGKATLASTVGMVAGVWLGL